VSKSCGVPISTTTLLGDTPVAQRAAAAAAGALVVTTPARIAAALREAWVQPQTLAASLQMLVLDEADLLLSYGYSEDLQSLAVHIPRSAQCLLMSATSSAEVEQLQQLILHNPITLNLLLPTPGSTAAGSSEGGAAAAAAAAAGGGGGSLLGVGGAGAASEIVHYGFDCSAADRRLVVLSLLKLGLLRKKVRVGGWGGGCARGGGLACSGAGGVGSGGRFSCDHDITQNLMEDRLASLSCVVLLPGVTPFLWSHPLASPLPPPPRS